MEERIIDDEFGRGVRLKKTKDGYVDVTDEVAEGSETEEEYEGDEVEFAFPVFDTDDEELVGLTPEEAMEVRRRREEELQARKAEYAELCEKGEELLTAKDYEKAEEVFEKALAVDIKEEPTQASVGYWRAKTQEFENPEVLADEYVDVGVENMEYDLGYTAVDTIKEKYAENIRKARSVWAEKASVLEETVAQKRADRKEYLKPQVKKRTIGFVASLLPMIALLILTIVFSTKNFSVRGNSYILPTIISGALLLISLFVFVAFANKFINALRLYFANERLSATEEGRDLIRAREYLEIYDGLTQTSEEEKE